MENTGVGGQVKQGVSGDIGKVRRHEDALIIPGKVWKLGVK